MDYLEDEKTLKMATILIVGCGDIGMRLALRLIEKGHDVTGLRRRSVEKPHPAMKMVIADITRTEDLEALDDHFDQVFFAVAPDSRDERQYRAIYETGLKHLLSHFSKKNQTPHLVFVSSTRVYGESQGGWVDEETPLQPKDIIGKLLRLGEEQVLVHRPDNIIVRFSGIYGPGRQRLLRLAKEGAPVQRHPPYYTNRIHQDDCAGVLVFLLEARLSGKTLKSCYLASDDAPASMFDVMSWLAGALGYDPPPEQALDAEAVQNKRCRNDLIKSLGYVFQYPSYREGYLPLIDDLDSA